MRSHRGETINSHVYTVVWGGEGEDGSRFYLGLSLPGQPECTYAASHTGFSSGQSEESRSHTGVIRGSFRPLSGVIPTTENTESIVANRTISDGEEKSPEMHKREYSALACVVPVGAGHRHVRMAPLAEWG